MTSSPQLRSSIQTQHGTDRLHSSGVSPRFTRQGLRLGTTESDWGQQKDSWQDLLDDREEIVNIVVLISINFNLLHELIVIQTHHYFCVGL